jgi:hypothetical protein
MANTNAPYGFRLWSRLSGGTGTVPFPPAQLAVASATTLKVGDPIKVTAGKGLLAGTTNAMYGVCNSPVPGWNETATQLHYPDIIPADDQTIFRCQSIGTVNATIALMGLPTKYRIGGSTSGYTGIDLSHTTGGVLAVVGLAPGSAYGTYAELLVAVTRGVFVGNA